MYQNVLYLKFLVHIDKVQQGQNHAYKRVVLMQSLWLNDWMRVDQPIKAKEEINW